MIPAVLDFMRRGGLAVALLLSLGGVARSQDWALAMFDKTNHDFGTVARGAKVEQAFTIENIYLEDAHILSARASCGCTTPEISRRDLKTWEKAQIVAKVDTRGYLGQKDVTITVVLDKPFQAEIQLHIHVYIRSDVVFNPGVVQFGSVTQGMPAQQHVSINYAGRSNWRIQRVECENPAISGQVVETARRGQQVSYDLLVALKPNAPPGYIHDQLYLVTDDTNPRAARVPMPVEGVVQPGITAHPSPLFMGMVAMGSTLTRQLVVRGAAPFRIVRVTASDPRFKCDPPTTTGTLHRLPVTFAAGQSASAALIKPGETTAKLSTKLQIETDSAGSRLLDVDVEIQVTVPEAAEPAATLAKPATEATPPVGPILPPAEPHRPTTERPQVPPPPIDSAPRDL